MRGIRVAAALILLLGASRAADLAARWPVAPHAAVQGADLPGSAAQAISIRAAADGTVFLGWLGTSYDAVVVQKLSRTGAPLWGLSGATLRSGRPCFPAGDARIHGSGPLEMAPAPGGGLWTAWTENAGERDLRVQRLDGKGNRLLGDDGSVLFSGVPRHAAGGVVDSAEAAVLGDGRNGLHAVAVSTDGDVAGLRYRHLPSGSTDGAPDRDVLLDGSGGDLRYPLLAALPDRSLAALWWRDGEWRLQVLRDGEPALAEGGVGVKSGAAAERAGVRATGRASRPLVLLSLRLSSLESRLLLLESDGTVLRDEVSFPDDAGLSEAAEVATVGGIVHGLPEGIDLHGILPGDPRNCLRAVRMPGGAWTGPDPVDPPRPVGAGQTGAVGGPLWFWALDNGTDGRLVAYRLTTVGRDLVPRLGPWLAICPGADDGSRMDVRGKWLYTTWVDPGQQTVLATRALVGRLGRERPLGPLLEKATLQSGTVTVEVRAPNAARPKSLGDLRLFVGGEEGIVATLELKTVTRGPGGTWKATLADPGGSATAVVETHPYGQPLTLDVSGAPVSSSTRALFLRLVDRGTAWTTTVMLHPLAGGGSAFVPGEE